MFQLVQCLQRTVDTQVGIVSRMLQLQQLDRPLNVRQSALAELQMAIPTYSARQTFSFHTCLEFADFGDLRFRKIDFRITQRVGDVHEEILGKRRVACRISCA